MKFKIRTKVTLGIMFLFAELIIIGLLGIYYFSSINNSTELMIKNNYQSVQYSENMIQAIDETQTSVTSLFLNKLYHYDKNSMMIFFKKFEENLNLENNNITEFGEKELVETISQKYFKYKAIILKQSYDSITNKENFYFVNILPVINEIKTTIHSVSNLNMHAIIQKNDNLNDTITRFYKNLTIILSVCFLLTFSFMYNFPNYIAKPIKEITENIKEIANKDFKSQIKFTSKDEFKQLTEAFNFMAEKIEKANQQVSAEQYIIVKEGKSLNERLILQNVQSLLGSVRELMNSLSKVEKNDDLFKQSQIIQNVEQELTKIIQM
jgi:nitrogen fixation/metabolism regulation signal transduction histidine kinase